MSTAHIVPCDLGGLLHSSAPPDTDIHTPYQEVHKQLVHAVNALLRAELNSALTHLGLCREWLSARDPAIAPVAPTIVDSAHFDELSYAASYLRGVVCRLDLERTRIYNCAPNDADTGARTADLRTLDEMRTAYDAYAKSSAELIKAAALACKTDAGAPPINTDDDALIAVASLSLYHIADADREKLAQTYNALCANVAANLQCVRKSRTYPFEDVSLSDEDDIPACTISARAGGRVFDGGFARVRAVQAAAAAAALAQLEYGMHAAEYAPSHASTTSQSPRNMHRHSA